MGTGDVFLRIQNLFLTGGHIDFFTAWPQKGLITLSNEQTAHTEC